MPALSYYTNVHNTALVILKGKGFRIWRDRELDAICAEKDGWDFMAFDPVQLLGLVSIYETKQPAEFREYWWRIDRPLLYDRVSARRPKFIPIWERKSKSFAGKVAPSTRIASGAKKRKALGTKKQKA
jgi:hypothetical protein